MSARRAGKVALRPAARAFVLAVLATTAAGAQDVSAPGRVPAPGPVTDGPYAPQPILPGGIVITLYAPGSRRQWRARRT